LSKKTNLPGMGGAVALDSSAKQCRPNDGRGGTYKNVVL